MPCLAVSSIISKCFCHSWVCEMICGEGLAAHPTVIKTIRCMCVYCVVCGGEDYKRRHFLLFCCLGCGRGLSTALWWWLVCLSSTTPPCGLISQRTWWLHQTHSSNSFASRPNIPSTCELWYPLPRSRLDRTTLVPFSFVASFRGSGDPLSNRVWYPRGWWELQAHDVRFPGTTVTSLSLSSHCQICSCLGHAHLCAHVIERWRADDGKADEEHVCLWVW